MGRNFTVSSIVSVSHSCGHRAVSGHCILSTLVLCFSQARQYSHAKFFFCFFALLVQNTHKYAIFVDIESADCSHKDNF